MGTCDGHLGSEEGGVWGKREQVVCYLHSGLIVLYAGKVSSLQLVIFLFSVLAQQHG